MMRNFCLVRSCLTSVRRNQLMCYRHWQSVPEQLRAKISDGYQGWLVRGYPPAEYVRAIREAIAIASGAPAAPDPEQRELAL